MMLTSFGGHERMVEALKSGAVGYVVKDTAPADLLNALRSIAATGKTAYCFLTSATSAATEVRASPNSMRVFGL